MQVFNLRENPINYRGKHIPGNGGSVEYLDMSFVPDRDKALETGRVLAFGSLPAWWLAEQEMKRNAEKVAATPVKKAEKVTAPEPANVTPSVEEKVVEDSSRSSFAKKKP